MIPTERDLELIVRRVRSTFDATAIYLFGSHARGSGGSGSDIDLLIVGPSRQPQHRRGREVEAALRAFPASFDLLFYTEDELADARHDPLSFASTILINAKLLYERVPQTQEAVS